jgi:flagellar basal-body rod modification protein FlgD
MEIAATPTATPSASQATTAKPVISSDFETFLKMLSTQLQNQDPLNPVDSADYAVQLATFSSVEQQVLTNNHLENLVNRIQLSGMSDLAGWVGMEALSPGAAGFDGTTPITLVPDPPAAADRATLVVKDASGAVVQRTDLPLTRGPVEWDGSTMSGTMAPPGSYSFELESEAEGELLSTDPILSYARVVEARLDGTETTLVLSGGGTVSATEVAGLRQ